MGVAVALALLLALLVWLFAPGLGRRRSRADSVEPVDADELEAAEREVRDLGVDQRPADDFTGDDWGPGAGPRKQARGGASLHPYPGAGLRRHPEAQTSRWLTYFAFFSMKSRRGSTSSPINSSNSLEASTASDIVTRRTVRFIGSMVVFHNWPGFISPRPLYRWMFTFPRPSGPASRLMYSSRSFSS